MYGLIGSFTAAEGKRAELVQILLADVGTLPGCRSYVVAEDPSDEETLRITEVWDSQAAHKASLVLPSVKAAIARAMPIIARFGEHRETRPVGGHGLSG
jgi:quinol monooxygenase YgiN